MMSQHFRFITSLNPHQQHRHDGLLAVFTASCLSIAAFILTLAFSQDCRFYQVTTTTTTTTLGHSMSIGLWTVQEEDIQHGSCVVWNAFIQKKADHHQQQQQQQQQLQLSDALDEPMMAARSISALLCFSCWIFPLLLLVVSFSYPSKCWQLLTTLTALFILVVGMLLAALLSLFSLVALTSDLCTKAVDCAYGRDAVLAVVASFLWSVAAGLVVYYFVQQYAQNPLVPNTDEKTTISITPAAISPHDDDIADDIYLQDGIPSLIAATTSITKTTNNKTSTPHGHGNADDDDNNTNNASIRSIFDDGISALELPIIGPSIRHPVYDNDYDLDEQLQQQLQQQLHYTHEDAAASVCYMYSSPPTSFDYLQSCRNLMYDHNDNAVYVDDDDSYALACNAEGAVLNNIDLVPSLTISSSYNTCNEHEEQEEKDEEQETEDSLVSSVMTSVLNRNNNDKCSSNGSSNSSSNFADDEQGGADSSDELDTL